MIPLQNPQQQHLGFLLPAGLPDDYLTARGQWAGDCVFMALPQQAELFDDPAFRVLEAHSHRVAGEHRLSVHNDGEFAFLVALAPDGRELFVRLPLAGPGAWGTRVAGIEAQVGLAVRVANTNA